jgi:hypothetical protein
MNVQHRTSNIERRIGKAEGGIGNEEVGTLYIEH